MNKRETSSNKQNHLQVEKDISELFPLAGNGLRLLSVLTPKANLPNGFSAASIFPNKPFGMSKGKSRTQTYKDSLTNLNSFTKPSQQTEIGLMKSKSPAHVGHFFRGETLRQPSVLSKTSKKHLDSKHLKSSLSLLGLTGKLTEDSTAALFSSTGGAKVKTLHANTSGLGNSLYTLLTTPTMTTNMKKEFNPDHYEHRHQNMSIRDHGTTENKRLDYLLENPEDDFHFQTQKHTGKHPRGPTSYASGKDLSARVHKKQSVHSIDPQQLTTIPGHTQHIADSKRSRIIKGTCMQPKYAPGRPS